MQGSICHELNDTTAHTAIMARLAPILHHPLWPSTHLLQSSPFPSFCPSWSRSLRRLSKPHSFTSCKIPYPRLTLWILHDEPRPHRPPFLPNTEIRIAHPLLHQELAKRLEDPADQLMGKALFMVLNCDGDAVGVVVEMERQVEVGVRGAVLGYGEC